MENYINHVIEARRSIYPIQYTGTNVSDEVIMKILDNANWAPTHHYTEPWRFRVFTEKGLEKLIDFIIEEYKNNTPVEEQSEKKLKKYTEYPTQVSHIIAISMQRPSDVSVPEIEDILAVGCAIENIYLSLQEYKLGGYLSTGLGTYSREMHNYLSLKLDEKLIGFFFIGQFEGKVPRGRKRKPVTDKTEWIRS